MTTLAQTVSRVSFFQAMPKIGVDCKTKKKFKDPDGAEGLDVLLRALAGRF